MTSNEQEMQPQPQADPNQVQLQMDPNQNPGMMQQDPNMMQQNPGMMQQDPNMMQQNPGMMQNPNQQYAINMQAFQQYQPAQPAWQNQQMQAMYTQPMAAASYNQVPYDPNQPIPMFLDQGNYQGEFDAEGARCGKGQCTYSDGSHYDGTWKNNMKDGYGTLTRPDGSGYKGNWAYDEQDGKGESFNAKEIVQANFISGKKYGSATVTDKKTNRTYQVDYYGEFRQTKIETQPFPFFDEHGDKIWCDLISMIIFYVGLFAYGGTSDENKSTVLVVVALAWICSLCANYCCQGQVWSMLNNVIEAAHIQEHIVKVQCHRPIITFHIECYHYETHRDGKGHTRREKKVTHRAQDDFDYVRWQDQSPPSNIFGYLTDQFLTRCYFDYSILKSDQSAASFNRQYDQFFEQHKRDQHQSKWVTDRIEEFKPFVLVQNNPDKPKPLYAQAWFFVLMSIFQLQIIPKYCLLRYLPLAEYEYKKYIIN